MNEKTNSNNKKREVILGTFLTIIGGILWGISGVCGQFLFQNKEVTASWLVPIRLVTAGVLLLCYYFIRIKGKTFDIWRSKRNRGDIIIYGLAGMMLCQYSYFQTIEWSNAGTATVIQYLGPALIVVWVCLRTKRLPEKKEVLGVTLAVTGIFLIATHGNPTINALRLAGELICLGGQRAVRCQNAQLCAACRLSIGHGQPRHVQHRHGQCLGQAVVEIVGGVAGDSNDRSAVVHQAETVLLHDGEGIVLAFAHDERRAVRRGRAGGNDDVNMILVTGCGGVVDQHLVQVAAGGRPQPTQDAQNFFMGVLRQVFLRRGAPLLITVFLFIIKRSGEICKMLI